MFDQNAPQEGTSDYNEAAEYAAQYTQLGGQLNLGPSLQDDGDGSFELSKPETDDDVMNFYEQNPNLYLDLSQPDAEQTWHSLVKGMKNRHDSIWETLQEAGSEIAKLPMSLAEGMMESPDLRTWTASTIEGAARGLRDMYGMVAESQNPTSLLFNFKSALKAITSGKPSQNWQEEAQQWNEARKFMYGSQKMMEGDETLLDQFDFLNSSTEAKEKWRSFVNPKIAHVMAFMGLEIPSLLMAPFTAGATGAAALSAGVAQGARGAIAAQRAGWFAKTGQALARHQANFENMSSRFTQRMVGNTASALGAALEPIANIAEGAIGGTIRNVAERSGIAEGTLANAAQTIAARGAEAAGVGQVRQTVGFLGSMGLRSTSELLKEIGETNLNLANGVVGLRDVTGLTVLERVAANPMLSGSAQLAAKFLNVTVDPLVQMSTAALKNGYKDALIFGTLGFANDNMRGAAGGAATGLVWGGYSGAFRHTWSAVTGGMQHGIQMKHFDENVLPIIEQQSLGFATASRQILADVDKLKSTRISSNTRVALQVAFASMSKADRAEMIFHVGDVASLEAYALSKGVVIEKGEFGGANAAFALRGVKGSTEGKLVPILFVNKKTYRPIDVGHEIMAHVLSYNLGGKGMVGDFFRQMIGTKENGGVFGNDNVLLDSIVRRKLAELATHEEYTKAYISEGHAKSTGEIFGENAPSGSRLRYRNWYEGFVKKNDMYNGEMTRLKQRLKEIRYKAAEVGDVFWSGGFKHSQHGEVSFREYPLGDMADSTLRREIDADPNSRMANDSRDAGTDLRYIFEENIAQYSEALFLHTNLADITKGASAPLRLAIESLRTNMFAKQLNQLEMAGIQARMSGVALDKNGAPVVQAYVYDNGKYYRSAEMDGLVRRMVRTAMDLDGQSIEKLSPQRMAMEARRYGKEYLFNMGGVAANMLSVKQRNDLLSKRAEQSMRILESLDPKIKPPIDVDIHGNKSVDMYKMSNEAYDALVTAGVLDKHAAETAKAWRDAMLEWERTGYVSPNTFSAEYLGDSHRTVKDGWFRRIFKPDTPVTHRMFVPYELRMAFNTTSADGTALRAPKGHMLATVLDVNALFRSQLKSWSRPDVQATFKDLTHFRNTFQSYLMNFMKEPSARVPSADLFRAEFGKDAEKVRNIMHETFGARKRADESYTNVPREGYQGNPENPNYPIHSMRLEYIVGAEKMPSVPVPFNINTSYEPLRTNKSVSGFSVVNEDGSRLRSGQGFEIFSGRSRHKLYSPYGEPIGVFDSVKKAIKASQKYLGQMDEADVMPMPTEVESLTKPSNAQSLEAFSDKSAIQSAWNGVVMKSVVGWDVNGNPRVHEMSFADNIFDTIKNSYSRWFVGGKLDTNRTNYSELRVGDLMSKEQGLALRKFCNDCGIKNNFEEMRVIPSLRREDAAVQRKHATGVYEYETEARAYAITDSLRTNGLDMSIDMDFVSMISDNDPAAASRFIESIIKKELLRRSLSYSVFGEEFSGHSKSLSVIKAGELQHAQFIEKFIKDWGTGKPTTAKIAELEVFRRNLRSDIQVKLNDPQYRTKTGKTVFEQIKGGLESELGDGVKEVFPELTPKTFREEIGKLPFSKSLEGLDFELQKFGEDVLKLDDFGMIVIPDAQTGVPYGSVALKGILISESLKKIDALISSAGKESPYVGYIAGGMANRRIHGLFQLVGETREGKAASLKGINYGDVAGRDTFGRQTIISSEFTARQIANVDEVISVWSSNANDSSIQSRTSGGFVTVYHPESKNSIWGGSAGAGEAASRQTSSPVKNFSSRTASGNGLPISAFDNVIRNRANGNIGRYERFVSEGNHLAALKALSLGLLESNFDQGNMTGEKFALEVAKTALKENNDAVLQFALAVAQVEKVFNDANFQNQLMQGRFGDKPQFQQPLLKYAQDQALGELRAAIQDYFALPTTNHSKTLDSVYSLREGQKLADGIESTKTLFGIELKKALFSEAKGLMNKVEPSVMKSVAGIEGFSDSVRDELVKKGWLRSHRHGGKLLQTFEFSDKDAAINLSLVQGEQHLLPWVEMGDLQANFDAYQKDILDNAANGISTYNKQPAFPYASPFGMPTAGHVTTATTLGKIFSHPELYKYFPELKNVQVRWADFYGAYMQRSGGPNGEPVMTLGIRSCSAFKMLEETATGGLPAEQAAFANSYRTVDSYRSRFASENPFASTILHEIQHYLQYKTNIETPQYRLLGKAFLSRRESFANMTGMWKILPEDLSGFNTSGGGPDAYMMMKYGNLFKKATESQGKLATPENIAAIANSPFFKSINGRAGHLVRSAYQTMYGFLAEELDAKRLSPSYGDKLEALTAASLTATMGGDGMLNFYNHLVDLHEDLSKESANFRSAFPIHDEFYMVKHAIGAITDLGILDASDPVHFGATFKSMVDHVAMMDYNLVSHERMARETQRRAGMTQEELLATPRVSMEDPKVLRESKSNDPIVDIINTAIAKGEANSGAWKSIMKSIGGIGERSNQDSAILEGLGKMSLLNVQIHKAWDAIDNARAVAVNAAGWFIDEGGRVRLRNGRYILRGKNFQEVSDKLTGAGVARRLEGQNKTLEVKPSYVEGSYTIEDLANLADVVVESRMEMTVGNELVDAILSPAFPATVKADSIMGELAKVYVPTEDQAFAANLMAIQDVMSSKENLVLTKNDLANLIIFYHKTISTNFEQTGSSANIYARGAGTVDISSVPRERKIAALIAETSSGTNNQAVLNVTGVGRGTGFFRGTEDSRGVTIQTKYGMGRFVFNANKIQFDVGDAPEWVNGLGAEAIALWKERGTQLGERLLSNMDRRTFLNYAESGPIIDAMNVRLANKLLLIEPILDKAMESMLISATNNPIEKIDFAVSLIDEMSRVRERVAFGTLSQESILGNVNDGTQFGSPSLPQTGNSMTSTGVERVVKQLGGLRLNRNTTGFGDVGSQNMKNLGYDPFNSNSNASNIPAHSGLRPMGMLTFMAGSIINADAAEGISTSTSTSSFGVGGMTPYFRDTARGEMNWVEIQNGIPVVEGVSRRVENVADYYLFENGNMFWSNLGGMADSIKEQVSYTKDRRSELKAAIVDYISTYEGHVDETNRSSNATSKARETLNYENGSGNTEIDKAAMHKIIEGLDITEAKRLLAQIELEDASIPREFEILDTLADIASKRNITQRAAGTELVERSMAPSNVAQRYYAGRVEPIFPVEGTQGMSVEGVGLFNVVSFTADSSVQNTYKYNGIVNGGIPSEIRAKQTNAAHAADITMYNAMFANVINNTRDGQVRGMANWNVDRLSIFHDVAVELSDLASSIPSEAFDVSNSTNSHLSHLLGGNFLAIFSIVNQATHAEGLSLVDYASRFPLINQISEGTPYAEVIPSPIRGLSEKTQSGTKFHSSLLGVASALPLAAILNRGYVGWTKGATLGLVIPDAVGGYNFFRAVELAKGSVTGGTKVLLRNEEFRASVKKFVEELTSEDINRLALECCSHANASTISNMMSFLNAWGLTKEQTQRTVGNAKINEALSAGLASGANFRFGGHPAVPETMGMPKESMARLLDIFKTSMRQESFWTGYFVTHHGLEKADFQFPMPTGNNVNEGNGHAHTRGNYNDGRGVGYVWGVFPKARFSIEGGHPIDADTTFPFEQGISFSSNTAAKRQQLNESVDWKYFQPPSRDIIAEDAGTQQGLSFRGLSSYPSAFDYGLMYRASNNVDSFNNEIYWKALGDNLEVDDGPQYHLRQYNSSTAEYSRIERTEVPAGDVGSRQISSASREFTRGFRRKIITNMIINAAEQMGVKEVGVQPARFSASAKPDRLLVSLTNTETRGATLYERPLTIHQNAFMGRAVLSANNKGSGFSGEVTQNGFSWQRLPDGRVMVNFTPHAGIAPSFDLGLASKFNGMQPLGINLRRTIGWDHTKGGLLIPQSFSRSLGLMDYNFKVQKYVSMQNMPQRAQALQMLAERFQKFHSVDPLVLEHAHIAAARVIKNLEFGENMTQHITELGESGRFENNLQTRDFREGQKKYIEEIMGGSTYLPESGAEGSVRNIHYVSSLLSMGSPENSYYTFILPKDFNESHIHDAISSLGLSHHPEAFQLSSLESREIHKSGWAVEGMQLSRDAFNPYNYNAHADPMLASYTRLAGNAPRAETSAPVRDSFVLPYEHKRSSSSSTAEYGGNHLSESTARFFSMNQTQNPMFMENLARLHERVNSQERGYYLPENERSVTMNGDRLAVIDAMFPNRPDLRQFAWDDSSKINLTVFRKSDRSGYVAGYDVVTGMDSAGLPVRRRVTRTFRTESEATAHANEVASKSILAEVPSIIAREGTAKMRTLSSKASAEAGVYKKIALDPATQSFVESGQFGVGNVNMTFATAAEAKAMRDVLLSPDIIAGEPRPRETIMLSTKGISELEQDVRGTINFGTMGSPYVFGSNLLKAINSGLVRDKAGNKQFKDAYTGKDWYDLFVANGSSKMEMRSSGVVEYLYANKDNMLTRQDLAEFTFAMYPRMARQVMEGTGTQGTTIGTMTIPNSMNPKQLFDNSMAPYAGHIMKVMDLTKHNMNGPHPEIYKGVQEALTSAFRDAYASIYGREKANETFKDIADVWNAFNQQRLGRETSRTDGSEFKPLATPQMGELMRIGFNDFIAKAKLEHAADLAGLPLEMPDVLTGYEDPSTRPDYAHLPTLAHAPSYDVQTATQGMVTQLSGNAWSEYTSGIGPYQVDVLSGHFITAEMKNRSNDYISAIEAKIAKLQIEVPESLERTAEVERLRNMQNAVKRVTEVRQRIADNSGNLTSGHWRTPNGSVQYGHARYSFGAASMLSLPMEELHPLYGEMSKEGIMMPLIYVEEVQSDIYQKNTFGSPADGGMRLATDFRQAESSALYTELNEIKKRMIYLTTDKDTAMYPFRNSFGRGERILLPVHRMAFMSEISNLTKIERHAFLSAILANGGDNHLGKVTITDDGKVMIRRVYNDAHVDTDTGIRVDKSNTTKIAKQLADKLGISTEVPDVQFGPQGAGYLSDLLISTHQRSSANIGVPVLGERYLAHHAALNAMGFDINDKVPSTGNQIEFGEDLARRVDSDDTQMGISMKAVMLASVVDEGFQTSIKEIAKQTPLVNRTGHSFDFDALALRIRDKFVAKLNDPTWSTEKRRALRMVVRDLETTIGLPANKIVSIKHARTDVDSSGHVAENRFTEISYSSIYNDRGAMTDLLEQRFIWNTPVSESEQAINPPRGVRGRTRFVEHKLDKAYRIFAEQIKYMKMSDHVSQTRKNDAIRVSENMAKVYEQESSAPFGVRVGEAEWVRAHEEFSSAFRSSDLWGYGQRPLHTVTNDMQPSGYCPWVWGDSAALAEITKSKTAAGKHLEHMLSPVSELLNKMMPDGELEKLALRRQEIEKVLSIDPNASDGVLSDSIPMGEDGTYRSIMMQFYAMRALQSQRNGIAFADARHHRNRYQANGNVYGTMMLGPNLPFIMTGHSGSSINMARLYILNEAAKYNPNGFLMTMAAKGLHTMSPEADPAGNTRNLTCEFNGERKTLVEHAMADVETFISEDMVLVGGSLADMRITVKNFLEKAIGGDALGKRMADYAKTHGPTGLDLTQMERMYVSTYGGEEGKNMFKRVAKLSSAPVAPFVSTPFGRTNGYTANYGAPKWNNKLYFSGMDEGFINGISNDAFQRPTVALAPDGTYTLSDPKTNKPIVTGVKPEELNERVAQNSKYLGKSPMITPFLKAFGKAGAYVMDGSIFSNRNINNTVGGDLFNAMLPDDQAKLNAVKGNIGMQNHQAVDPKRGADVFAKMQKSGNDYSQAQTQLRSSATVPMGSPAGEGAAEPIYMNAALHAAGLRMSASSDEVAAAVGRIGSFSSPVLVIKPRYPTQAHLTEMKKILADGVPLMSVKGIGGETGAVNGAIQGFRHYATPTAQQQDERN